jgi:hypothetical protein
LWDGTQTSPWPASLFHARGFTLFNARVFAIQFNLVVSANQSARMILRKDSLALSSEIAQEEATEK